MKPLFELGQLVITPSAMLLLTGEEMSLMLHRHASGAWGELDAEDTARNNARLLNGTLLSAYTVDETRYWVVTEWDRSVTTILLPEEY